MINRTPNRQSVAWFVDLINRKLMILDPPYQRRSVWAKSYKVFFIDTIMRNYPSPPIFLNVVVNSDGIVNYFVVDGRQRLESIMDFVNLVIALPDKFGNKELDGKYFNELSEENKKKFWGYEMSVENLSSIQEEIINDTFDRLNRNVLKLTAQELRHARFDGGFITVINEIASDPFWVDICISRTATIRRMKDIEFISELFLMCMHGIETSTKDMLDEYYAKYDDEIPDEEKHRKNFDKIKELVLKLNLDICSNRLKLYSDFYTLWSVLAECKNKNLNFAKTRKNILEFLDKVEKNDSDKKVMEYLQAIRSQPNEAQNRELRKKIFRDLIKVK